MYLMWLIQSQEIRYGPYGHGDLLLQPNWHWLIVERRVLIFRVEVSIIIGFIQMLTFCRVWFSFRKRFQQGSGPGTVKLHDVCTGLSHLRFPIEWGTRKDSLFLRYLVKSWFNHLIPAVSDTLIMCQEQLFVCFVALSIFWEEDGHTSQKLHPALSMSVISMGHLSIRMQHVSPQIILVLLDRQYTILRSFIVVSVHYPPSVPMCGTSCVLLMICL